MNCCSCHGTVVLAIKEILDRFKVSHVTTSGDTYGCRLMAEIRELRAKTSVIVTDGIDQVEEVWNGLVTTLTNKHGFKMIACDPKDADTAKWLEDNSGITVVVAKFDETLAVFVHSK